MTQTAQDIKKGLIGVTVDETAISKVNPETNSLLYYGYPVQDLAEHCRFEDVAYLLWHGELPDAAQYDAFVKQEQSLRALPANVLSLIEKFPSNAHPMDTLRTALSLLGVEDKNTADNSAQANYQKALSLFAKTPTIVAACERVRQGKEPIAPRRDLGFAENFFHMMFGEVPAPELIRCFDISLILYAEHSFNASTFTGRVVASTLSDMYSAVVAAVGALKGPLHGGANEAVMHIMLEVGSADKAKAWLENAFATKKLIMGFGHRVYKNGDSRVPTMTKAFYDVAKVTDGQKWVDIAKILEETMITQKSIHPNLDFPTGPAYYLMGFDIPVFTPIFVMSRMTGWTAHIIEQWKDNKLIRPLSAYNGPAQRAVPPRKA